jgi:hypothetical protein
MKKVPPAMVCFVFALAALSVSAQKFTAGSRVQPLAASAPAPSTSSPALTSALNDLDRVSSATEADLANMGSGGEKNDRSWKNAWRFWHPFSSPRATYDEKAVASLQRNLHDAMPGLIQNARTSGTFAATFKLYNNLSVVCELLDSMVNSSHSQGKVDTALANDSSAMGRIRQDLAGYVEQTAASLDARSPYAVPTPSNGKAPRRIVVDDTVPQKKPAVRKTAAPAQQ